MSVFDAGRMCAGSQLERKDQERGLPSTLMRRTTVGECLLAETDSNGSPGQVQGAREVLSALSTQRPVMLVLRDVAGFASGISCSLGFRVMFAWAVLKRTPIQWTPDSQCRSVFVGSVAQD